MGSNSKLAISGEGDAGMCGRGGGVEDGGDGVSGCGVDGRSGCDGGNGGGAEDEATCNSPTRRNNGQAGTSGWRELEASSCIDGGGLSDGLSMPRGTHLKPPAGADPVQDFSLWPCRKQRQQRT